MCQARKIWTSKKFGQINCWVIQLRNMFFSFWNLHDSTWLCGSLWIKIWMKIQVTKYVVSMFFPGNSLHPVLGTPNSDDRNTNRLHRFVYPTGQLRHRLVRADTPRREGSQCWCISHVAMISLHHFSGRSQQRWIEYQRISWLWFMIFMILIYFFHITEFFVGCVSQNYLFRGLDRFTQPSALIRAWVTWSNDQ